MLVKALKVQLLDIYLTGSQLHDEDLEPAIDLHEEESNTRIMYAMMKKHKSSLRINVLFHNEILELFPKIT